MINDGCERLLVIETLNRYAWGYDTRDLDMIAASFTENGSFDVTLEGHGGWGPYQGRRAIVDWLASVMAEQTDQRRHCVSNVLFRSLDSDSAEVDSYLVLTAVERGDLRVVCTGTYHDRLIKQGGAWLIRQKTLHLDNPF